MFRTFLVGCSLLVACSRPERGASDFVPVRRLSLAAQASAGQLASRELTVVHRLSDLNNRSAWTFESEAPATAGGPLPLACDAPSLWRRRFEGEFVAGSFERLVLRGRFRERQTVEVRLIGAGGERRPLPGRQVSGTEPGETTIEFELADLRRRPQAFAALVIRVYGQRTAFELTAVEFVHVPLVASLPSPVEGPGLISLGVDAQRGVGLHGSAPLTAEFEVGGGDELRFAYGQPAELRAPGETVKLVATLAGGGGQSVEQRFEAPRTGVWTQARIPLEVFAGGRARLTLALECEVGTRPDDVLWAIAEPRLTRTPAVSPPTVLLVTSDTHRGDHLAVAAGAVDVETPALDALAERGVLFEDCYATTNVTSPSHVAILTGRSPRDTRILNNSIRMTSEAHTLAEAFRSAGFLTFAVVSVLQVGPRGTGLGQGFDRMAGPAADWDATVAVDKILTWLPAARNEPVFVWLHVFDAHFPYAPPSPFDRSYYPVDKDPFDAQQPELGLPEHALHAELRGLRDLEFPRAQYRGEVSYLDSELARVFLVPRIADGVVAFTADHGEIFEKNGVYFNHAGLYPDNLHVPLLLAWPGGPRGQRIRTPVDHLDLGRTLLDLAGLEEVSFPGHDLRRASAADEAGVRPRFALEAHGNSASIALGQWFLVLHLRDHGGRMQETRRRHETRLHDLARDPECLANSVDEQPERARRLRALLVKWLLAAEEAGLSRVTSPSLESLERLAALGYSDEAEGAPAGAWFDPGCECVECARFE